MIVPVRRTDGESAGIDHDYLAVEEPMEIRVNGRGVAITMRTPGDDEELASGFLFTEALIDDSDQIASITAAAKTGNVIDVTLAAGLEPDVSGVERNFYVASSCGVCGKTSISLLEKSCTVLPQGKMTVAASVIHGLPEVLRSAQPVFDRTGGLHAAALFGTDGTLLNLREDVGRHNALDKLIGHELLNRRIPLSERLVLVSGRASFELVQKAVRAGIPMMLSVGAPSSLAVQTALRFGMTLIGFVRNGRFNTYSGLERVR